MDVQNTLLLAHLIGAGYVGIHIVSSIFAIFQNDISQYRKLSSRIALGGGYQLVSGSILALVSVHSELSLIQFCSKIGLYTGIILFAEALLLYKMKKYEELQFPYQVVLSSLIFGLFFTIITIFDLYTAI